MCKIGSDVVLRYGEASLKGRVKSPNPSGKGAGWSLRGEFIRSGTKDCSEALLTSKAILEWNGGHLHTYQSHAYNPGGRRL